MELWLTVILNGSDASDASLYSRTTKVAGVAQIPGLVLTKITLSRCIALKVTDVDEAYLERSTDEPA